MGWPKGVKHEPKEHKVVLDDPELYGAFWQYHMSVNQGMSPSLTILELMRIALAGDVQKAVNKTERQKAYTVSIKWLNGRFSQFLRELASEIDRAGNGG